MDVRVSQLCFSAVGLPEVKRKMIALASLSPTSLTNNEDKRKVCNLIFLFPPLPWLIMKIKEKFVT